MKCQRVRALIALEAGDDLSEGDQLQMRRHLASCPHCREYAQQMRSCVQSLQDSAELLVVASGPSLWDSIGPQVAPTTTRRPAVSRSPSNQFNGWIPALALGAACLMIISFTGPTNRKAMFFNQQGLPNPVVKLPTAKPFPVSEIPRTYSHMIYQPVYGQGSPQEQNIHGDSVRRTLFRPYLSSEVPPQEMINFPE